MPFVARIFYVYQEQRIPTQKAFQVKKNTEIIARRQADLDERLDPSWQPETEEPVLGGDPITYTVSDRVTAVVCGGIGMIVQLVEHLDLPALINEKLQLLKRHLPYHESDHVLNMAYNIVVGGRCLEDLGQRRNDLGYLQALGARRIPDPTTAGDFLRRFSEQDVEDLMEVNAEISRRVWLAQPKSKRKLALIDVDGSIVETLGECKEGAAFAYNGKYGFCPLVVSLANSHEVLYTVNRSANRPSHDGAAPWLDKSAAWARSCGFKRVRLRGDTDFALTVNFDRWTEEKIEFIFGIDAHSKFVKLAEALGDAAWKPLKRPRRVRGKKRKKAHNFKAETVKERGYKTLRQKGEMIAEMPYRPVKSERDYRMIVLRKEIEVSQGEQMLLDKVRYFFYVTNIPCSRMSAARVIFESNARCHQENLIEQLKNGVRATQMPTSEMTANWAYMVTGAMAWNLKAWLGLILPEQLGASVLLRMEYRRFVEEVITHGAQIVRKARRLEYRLLQTGRWSKLLVEASEWFRRHRRRQAYV